MFQIFNGPSVWYGLIANLCGYEAPTEPIVSSSNTITIKLNANNRFEGSKFKLRFESVQERNGTVQYLDPNGEFCRVAAKWNNLEL